MMRFRLPLVLSVVLVLSGRGYTGELKVVGWNLQSGGAKPSFLVTQIADFQGIDLWGFSEVQESDAADFAAACAVGEGGQEFKHFIGKTGGSDRLAIVYNAAKLELLTSEELFDLSAETGRAPLLGVFKIKSTGEQFIFMVNHLHRTKPAKRMEQAVGLEKWAKSQTQPAVLVGDYNFDVNVKTKKGNAAYVAMTKTNQFRWVEPTPFRATHKSGGVLDFVFLVGPAKKWHATSAVVKLSDDASDTISGSDHRPVLAELKTLAPPPPPITPVPNVISVPRAELIADAEARQKKRNEILRKLADLERELAVLRRLVRELADE